MRARRTLLLCLAAALAGPSAAHAATLTAPAANASVGLQPSFSWSEAANEVLPSVTIARTPNYDDPGAQPVCSIGDDTDRTTSCSAGFPLAGGTWYAFVQTRDVNTDQQYNSPLVRFSIRSMIGFADTAPWGKNPPLQVDYVPHPALNSFGIKVPFSVADARGWLNDPGAKVAISYTVKHGRKVLKTAHHTQHAGGDEDWSFEDFFILKHLRGIANGARLQFTVALTGDGASTRRTTTIRNPPARG